MKKKKNILLSVILSCIAIILIIIGIIGVIKKFSVENYRCVKEMSTSSSHITNYVHELVVKKGRLMKANSIAELIFQSQDEYQKYKTSSNLVENQIFYDSELRTTFPNPGERDYTKDLVGEELIYKYQSYKESLEKQGYVCKKVSK